ncbi:LPAR6 protein, partial [Serilophus lunatus]|nr:LPAR6 protein [Serilophus lunatus]
MAGIPWAEGASSETAVNASSELWVGADFHNSLFSVTYSVVFVLGLVGNALALYLLPCRGKHVSHSYLYMVNLALLDTLFVCVLPFKIHSHLSHNNWIFGDVACRVTGTLFYINIYLSTGFFTCICVDCYIAVLHPFTYIQIRARHCVLVVTALWVVALGVTIPLILGGPLHTRAVRNTTVCPENFPTSSWTQHRAPANILAFVFGFVVPFSIVLVGFPLIARRISQFKRRVSKRKALRTIYIILGICALCFLPFHLTHLLHFLVRIQVLQNKSFSSLIPRMRRVTLALLSLSCCFNPLLYYFTSSSRQWHCSFRLRFRSKKVFTICDKTFGDSSRDYKLQQRHGSKKHRDGIN